MMLNQDESLLKPMQNMQELPKDAIADANILKNSLRNNGYIYIRNFIFS